MSKFLNDEELEIIKKMMEEKGFPKFHLIAFNTENIHTPKFQMLSWLYDEVDVFALKEIVEILHEQLDKVCSSMGNKAKGTDDSEIGEPLGNC